ncbi:DNA translocase FtsK [Apilactobacillus xinyiensis]|uniref:DNA translocase FtsK n=1 Tax=Apilactobacillus xinyiensis TaxID=2841032 RepID=UPI0020100E6B|nr:DNA translocase FtsK [Apilactobacillus xinyiensis]MCL0329514.1 FtsK/SpoIIIE domain-containing protein [Apilactobacillus xinyiensis]
MNHYDGPAFFRKYPNNHNKNFSKKARVKSIVEQVNKKTKNNNENTNNKPLNRSQPTSKLVDNEVSVDKNNPISKRVAAFQPTKIYEQKEKQVSYYQRPISDEYIKLKNQLAKSQDTFILINDNVSFNSEHMVKKAPEITIENVQDVDGLDDTKDDFVESSDKAKVFSNSSKEIIDNHSDSTRNDLDEKDSDLDTSKTTTSDENQVFNTINKKIDEHETTSDKVVVDTPSEVNNDDQNITDGTESVEQINEVSNENLNDTNKKDLKNDNISNEIKHVDNDNDSKTNRHSGLGHSLNSILGEENNAQKDLALFKDKPVQESNSQNYQFPSLNILNEPKTADDEGLDDWIENQAEILDETLQAFHVKANVVDWDNGPTVTQFQVKLKLGVKVNKITNLTDDLKLALAAKDIRIEAPIPGKTTVGIEIPNPKPRPVMLSEVLSSDTFRNNKNPLTVALGVDLTGNPQVTDLRKMPHGLIAGATGSGKSVFLNSLLVSLLYKATPAELKMILIDPKAVEMAPYNDIPHLISPVISDAKQASAALNWAVKEMDQRYEKLAASGARNIEQFNKMAEEHKQYGLKMPYILIVIDELADLMMVASAEVQDYIVRITQKARAAGIHLIVATQRPSVDVITGTIKNNIPTRVAFMVSSQVDSRTIIDTAGAERLLGKGDMLYLGNGSSQSMRLQGTFITSKEIEKITEEVKSQGEPNYAFQPKSLLKKVSQVEQQDELMPEVLKYISHEDTISTSKLQRVFSIGYNRAATLIDDLETHNYVSGQHGSKPRDVYLSEEDYKKLNV